MCILHQIGAGSFAFQGRSRGRPWLLRTVTTSILGFLIATTLPASVKGQVGANSTPIALDPTQVSTTTSGLVYSRVSHTFVGNVTLKNVSGTTLNGPFLIALTGLPSGVRLVNQAGLIGTNPYLLVPNTALTASQSVSIAVQFVNPKFAPISFIPVVYAGTTTGTVQGGGPLGGQVADIAIDPTQPNTIYVATLGGGVFKSTTGGIGWTAINAGLTSTYLQSLAIDPVNPSTVFATAIGGVFRSSNGGLSWTALTNGVTDDSFVPIAIDPQQRNIIYAGTKSGSIFKTIDGGTSWIKVATLTGLVWTLAIDPTNHATVYAGTVFGGVFKSTDFGLTWAPINSGITNLNVRSIAVDRRDAGIVYAGTDGGLFKTVDAGAHWFHQMSAIYPGNVQTLTLDASANPSTIYAGAFVGGLFKSDDGGASWIKLDTGLTHASLTTVHAIAVDPTDPTTLYAGADDTGMFKLTIGASVWNKINAGLAAMPVTNVVIDPIFGTVYAATRGGGVFKSFDRARSWILSSSRLTDPYVESLALDPQLPFTLAAGGSSSGVGVGVYVSTDNGLNWATTFSSGLPGQTPFCLTFDPVSRFTVYAGIAGNGVYKSTDNGFHWTPLNAGLGSVTVLSLAIDPFNPKNMYANTSGGLFQTINGGSSWTLSSSTIAGGSVAIDPGTPTTIFATGFSGLFKSANSGASWTLLYSGISSGPNRDRSERPVDDVRWSGFRIFRRKLRHLQDHRRWK